MPRPTRHTYQLTVTRDGAGVHQWRSDNLLDATYAAAEALVLHPDCEVRLVRDDAVLLSAGPALSLLTLLESIAELAPENETVG